MEVEENHRRSGFWRKNPENEEEAPGGGTSDRSYVRTRRGSHNPRNGGGVRDQVVKEDQPNNLKASTGSASGEREA